MLSRERHADPFFSPPAHKDLLGPKFPRASTFLNHQGLRKLPCASFVYQQPVGKTVQEPFKKCTVHLFLLPILTEDNIYFYYDYYNYN